MYRTIVVPLDGSQFAEQALPYAVTTARRASASLHLVLVHAPTKLWPMLAATDERVIGAVREWEREYLGEIGSRIGGETGLSVRAALLEAPVASAIHVYATEHDADLIVMATHGRGGLSRAWLGSVADRLVRTAGMPVLVIRPAEKAEVTLTGDRGIRRILVPLDGSDLAEQVLPETLRLGSVHESDLVLLRVVPLPFTIGSPYVAHSVHLDRDALDASVRDAERYLARVKADLERQSARVAGARVVAGSQIAETVLDAAQATDADLIALATHGSGGLKRAVVGSVADKVIRGGDLPVLVVRPEVGAG